MDRYDEYEKEAQKIRKTNKVLLNQFGRWLESSGLSKNKIKEHVSNIHFYLNEYLLYDELIEAKDGIYNTGMYLGYWFITKVMWSSRLTIKKNATSLKKFYLFLHGKGLVEKKELDALNKDIKKRLPEWLETMDSYDDPSLEKSWL